MSRSPRSASSSPNRSVPLLQRHARGVRPTPAGAALYREAAAILKRVGQLPGGGGMSIAGLAALPLVLSTAANVTRSVLDRAFSAAGLQPNAVSEGNLLGSIMAMVRTGLGGTVLPKGAGWTMRPARPRSTCRSNHRSS